MRLSEAFRSLRSRDFRSSDALRGRVMSLFTLIHGGCFPIAAPLIGAVAERSSVSAAFFVWGAGGLAVLALLMGDRRCAVGSWGGWCLSMADYVTGTGATSGVTAAGGR